MSSIRNSSSIQALWKLVDAPELHACVAVVKQLEEDQYRLVESDKDKLKRAIAAASKSFRAQKRHDSASNKKDWDGLILKLEQLSSKSKSSELESLESIDNVTKGLPTTVSMYLARLKSQKKELFKNPPALPPPAVVLETTWVSFPTRTNGNFVFPVGQDSALNRLLRDFRPNLSPEDVLRAGSFGGTYFRPITSAVTGEKYSARDALKDTVEDKWIAGLDKQTMLTSQRYDVSVNKYKIKCGGSLGMWESSGWISDADPYGWFQWYCRFFRGRRSSDDMRQISRWMKCAGPKGRFRSQLCNKILTAGKSADDATVSPVIRQTLIHWGLEINEDILDKHRRRTL